MVPVWPRYILKVERSMVKVKYSKMLKLFFGPNFTTNNPILQVKTEVFAHGLSIDRLHFGQGQGSAKIVFR